MGTQNQRSVASKLDVEYDPKLALVEARRTLLQAAFDGSRSLSERNKLGQFATPQSLALDIVRYIQRIVGLQSSICFCEPAIGTGSFYSAFLACFGSNQGIAYGIEKDADVFAAAKHLWSDFPLKLLNKSFVDDDVQQLFSVRPNLLVTNPPYVRHHHIEPELKRRLQDRILKNVGIKLSGLCGLYVYCLMLATEWLDEDGVGGWLIPSEFMEVNYGREIREYLRNRVTLISIHKFDPHSVQFEDALVTSSVVVYKKKPPPQNHEVTLTSGGSVLEPELIRRVTLQELAGVDKWSSLFMYCPRIIRRAAGVSLGDLFQIKRGIATGGNKFFILRREQLKELNIPESSVKPVLPNPRALQVETVETMDDGYPFLNPQLAIIDVSMSEEEVRALHPGLWNYLSSAGESLRTGYIVSKRKPWYKQELRLPAQFLCTYMGRSTQEKSAFRFIWNKSQAVATNVYLLLYPKEPLKGLLKQDQSLHRVVFGLLQDLNDQDIMDAGRVYGGGLRKVEPNELCRVDARRFLEKVPQLSEHLGKQSMFDF